MKNKKLIGLASLMLTLGATGCPKKTEPCEKHTWGDKVVLKEATCTEAGESERTCTVCGEKEEKKPIKALGHDWKDGAVAKEATCTEKGSKNQTCSRCNATQTADIPALGHNYVDDEEGLVPATCEAAGSKNQHCSRCNDPKTGVEIPALGHKYENYVTTVEATCEAPGKKVAQCENGCGKTDEQTINALGHKPVTDDTDEPEPGKAAVRVYHCENGCGQTFLGFKASEVTDASKARLTIGTDGGASFWGRPIGNSLALTEDGTSKNQQNNECVYCRDEQGDFFEYVFDLTAAQAATLGSCRLYCDAMPANYLTGDFWAYNGSSTDWTPGYYIDDEDEHIEKNEDGTTKMVKNHTVVERTDRNPGDEKDEEVPMGKRITNYRYVLYVDGKVKDFDPDTHVEVEANTRKEYVLPYTFNLHEGENRISLRMAGGYRSTFYNFTFRPYTEKTQITVDQATLEVEAGLTANITGASQEGVTYTSSNEAIATVDANGVVTGVKAGTAEIVVAKEGDFKPARVAVTVTPSTVAHVDTWGDATPVAAEGDGCAYDKYACTGVDCNNEKYVISVNNCTVTNWKDGTFGEGKKLSKSTANAYDGTAVATLKFNADKVMDGRFYALGGVDVAGNQKYGFHSGKNGNTPVVELADNATNTVFTINGNSISVPLKTYGECGIGENKALAEGLDAAGLATAIENGEAALIDIGDASLKAGLNTFTMAATNSYGLRYYKIVFIGAEHVHNYVATPVEAADGAMAYNKEVCSCGLERVALKALDGTFASGSSNKDGNPEGFLKLNGNGNSISYAFKAAAAGNVTIGIETVMDDFTRTGGNNSKTLKSSKGSAKYNITFAVGENEVDMTAIEDKLYSELYPSVPEGEEPIKASYSAITTFNLGTVAVAEGLNTLTITRNGSYNFIIRTIYIYF